MIGYLKKFFVKFDGHRPTRQPMTKCEGYRPLLQRVTEVVMECFDRAMAVCCLGDQAASGSDFFADGDDGIGGAGSHRGVGGIEHFEIVITVTDRKAVSRVSLIVFGNLT